LCRIRRRPRSSPGAGQVLFHGGLHRRGILRVPQPFPAVDGVADFRLSVAEHALPEGRVVDPVPDHIPVPEPRPTGGDSQVVPLLRLPQELLRPFAAGDVLVGSEHPGGRSVFPPLDDRALVQNPGPGAVLAAHPVLAFVPGGFSFEMVPQRPARLFAVLRVHQPIPGRDGDRLQFREGIAEYRRPLVVEDRLTRGDVPSKYPGRSLR
jgi:hypothetical protein